MSSTDLRACPTALINSILSEKWIGMTPAFERELCRRIGVPTVEFDGEHDSILAPLDLSGKPYINYLEVYEPQEDLPFDWIRGRVSRVWGDKRAWLAEKGSIGHVMRLSGFRF
jgi:hypothetical protein